MIIKILAISFVIAIAAFIVFLLMLMWEYYRDNLTDSGTRIIQFDDLPSKEVKMSTEFKTVFLGYSPFCVNVVGARKEIEANDELAARLINEGWYVYDKKFVDNGQAMFWVMVFRRELPKD